MDSNKSPKYILESDEGESRQRIWQVKEELKQANVHREINMDRFLAKSF